MELWNFLKPATKGNTFVQCSTCQTELLCAHGGRFDCKCHIETKGHLLFIYLKVLTNLKQTRTVRIAGLIPPASL